jgi:hypothetical protein
LDTVGAPAPSGRRLSDRSSWSRSWIASRVSCTSAVGSSSTVMLALPRSPFEVLLTFLTPRTP